MSKNLCPFCGAYDPRQCELEEESGGVCPWEESDMEDEIDEVDEVDEDAATSTSKDQLTPNRA